uniref:Myb-like domain-containing protein n=1 Tax=Davidia involucrata TaxID=16924 RepID=A0A5B7AZ74_DAVIN
MEETQLAKVFEDLQTPKKEDIEYEMEQCDGRQSRVSGSRRTRSQVAPDWSVQESMILVNEIAAVEGDCLKTLSSYQKWMIIVENCNALDVARSLNQCRRKWDSLLSEYKKIKKWESESKPRSYWSLDSERRREFGLSENFDPELFKVIDEHVKKQEDRSDTDPDSDPEATADVLDAIAESGSKKQKRRGMHQKRSAERRVKPQKHSIDEKIKPEQSSIEEKVKPPKCIIEEKTMPKQSSIEQKVKPPRPSIDEKIMHEESSIEDKKEMMAAKLGENAELINAILQGNLSEMDFRLADLKNESFQTDLMRRQGDKLIAGLGNLADTLDQFCDLVQQCS